jgi:catalase (peroxidase I)
MALHMTRADRVLSTPPTNTPTYTNRRRFLSVAAGSAVAAAIPAAAPAAAPAIDPIYAASDKHRQAVAAHDAATDVRAAFNDVNMNDERRTQLAVLEGAVDDAWDRLEDAGITLVNTDPTR